ncbi:MAG: nitroreductase [Patiriisocius sp.]
MKNIHTNIIYKFIRALVRYIRLGKSYFYDMNQYSRYSMLADNMSEKKLISKIILDTHVIEKGLTMPEVKLGFGQARLRVLMDNVFRFISGFSDSESQVLHAVSVIKEYFVFHENEKYTFDNELKVMFEKLLELEKISILKVVSRNQRNIIRDNYFSHSKSPFKKFSDSRCSIRNFSNEFVSKEKVYDALDLCRNAPSACNRQSVKVHVYRGKSKIRKILEVQGGNRGFGHLSSLLIIVTYESSAYFGETERNSGYVDGGMYCMNILYSLHANEIGACILNAANDPEKDIKMRNVSKVPDSECFVAMIAGGVPPENFKIARSFRYPLKDILVEH